MVLLYKMENFEIQQTKKYIGYIKIKILMYLSGVKERQIMER